MARVEIGRYLATDTRVCGGRLVFRGTRILVSDALDLLQAGWKPEQVAQEYRGLIVPEAIREALSSPVTRDSFVGDSVTRIIVSLSSVDL